MAELIKKQDPTICFLEAPHFSFKVTHRVEKKGKIYFMQMKKKRKKSGVAIPILDKIDLDCIKRQRRSLHNNKGFSSSRGYNINKY